jgi:hypothetical protein
MLQEPTAESRNEECAYPAEKIQADIHPHVRDIPDSGLQIGRSGK